MARFLAKFNTLTFLSLACSAHVCAEATTVYDLGTVEITAKKLNEEGGNRNNNPIPVASAITTNLNNIPNVRALGSARASGQVINIRGLEGDRLAYSLDGIPMQSNIAHNNIFDVDPALLRSVKIKQGAGSISTGDAFGGEVELQTKDAEDVLRPKENKGFYAGSAYQSAANELTFNGATYVRGDYFDNSLYFSHRHGADTKLGDGSKLNEKYRKMNALTKLVLYPRDEQKLTLQLQAKRADIVEPLNPQTAKPNSSNPIVDKNVGSTVGKIEYSFTPYAGDNQWVDFYARLYGTQQSKVYDVTNNHKISRSGLKLANKSIIKANEFDVNYGIDAWQEGASNPQITKARANLFALFVEKKWHPLADEKLQIIPAFRWDNYKRIDGNYRKRHFSPRLTVRHKPIEQISLQAKYVHAFRPPSFQEAFASGEHFKGRGYIPNNYFVPNYLLQPEKLNGVELGAAIDLPNLLQEGDDFHFEFTRFMNEVTDYIALDVNILQGTTKFVNIKRARLHGFEVVAKYSYKKISMQATVAHTTGKNQQSKKYLSTIVPLNLTTEITYNFTDLIAAGWQGVFSAANKKINKAIDYRSGYGVHNFFLTYTPEAYQNIEVSTGIDNIFNKAYTPAFAGSLAAGVNYKAQLGVRL
jgi:hemoglobin/transferrin/lactoferrin receptor protein